MHILIRTMLLVLQLPVAGMVATSLWYDGYKMLVRWLPIAGSRAMWRQMRAYAKVIVSKSNLFCGHIA